ncbi:DUF6072 family protein [Telmatospirillum siberiense]|uniref:DUF6072 family protein n=1 Tax=Telmatospirillum siberiense TaxID=382514 RepID=UPI0018EDA24E|nr:DUF6072 family protein [Telmatospirillum siberiense]
MPDSTEQLTNGVKLVGEALLPGTSLLMDGRFVDGAAHVVVGLGARILLGPLGVLVVAADSFSKSVTERHLWDHVLAARPKAAPAAGAPPARAET